MPLPWHLLTSSWDFGLIFLPNRRFSKQLVPDQPINPLPLHQYDQIHIFSQDPLLCGSRIVSRLYCYLNIYRTRAKLKKICCNPLLESIDNPSSLNTFTIRFWKSRTQQGIEFRTSCTFGFTSNRRCQDIFKKAETTSRERIFLIKFIANSPKQKNLNGIFLAVIATLKGAVHKALGGFVGYIITTLQVEFKSTKKIYFIKLLQIGNLFC